MIQEVSNLPPLGLMSFSRSTLNYNDTSLLDLLKQVQGLGATHTLISGDFNFPHIDWSYWSSPQWDTAENVFLETLGDQFLFQHMLTPRHLSRSSSINSRSGVK